MLLDCSQLDILIFVQFCTIAKVDTSYRGKAPTAKSKIHRLHGLAFTKSAPVASRELTQAEAKLYCPPGCLIWRANVRGAWLTHLHSHKEHAEPWANHGFDSTKAMMACVRFAWLQWLDDRGLDTSHYPHRGHLLIKSCCAFSGCKY